MNKIAIPFTEVELSILIRALPAPAGWENYYPLVRIHRKLVRAVQILDSNPRAEAEKSLLRESQFNQDPDDEKDELLLPYVGSLPRLDSFLRTTTLPGAGDAAAGR
jgi:hypothetical protein